MSSVPVNPTAARTFATDVVVAIVTFRRARELERLLASLRQVTFSGRARVLVVDNDPAASARAVVEQEAVDFPFRLDWAQEPTPGIAAARNRAVELCGDAGFIAFIDDDEVPSGRWLEELFAAQRRYDADMVAGPVLSITEGGPSWLGPFFVQERHETGFSDFHSSTANLLVRLAMTERLGPLFDNRFGLTGGSDWVFSIRARRAGFRLVWADEAEVTEYTPQSRQSPQWLLRRAYRCGGTAILAQLASAPSAPERLTIRLRGLAAGLPRIGYGGLRVMAGIVGRDRGLRLRGRRSLAAGAGMITGSLGLRYVEYRRPGRDAPAQTQGSLQSRPAA